MTEQPATPSAVVVGAGPVGLTMASELTRHGVACHIIDKDEGTTTEPRALVVHALWIVLA